MLIQQDSLFENCLKAKSTRMHLISKKLCLIFFLKLGDYLNHFLEEVGHDPRAMNPLNIPGDIRPGSESDKDYDD